MKQLQSNLPYRFYLPRDTQMVVVMIGSLMTGIGLWYALPKGFAGDLVSSPLLLVNILLLYPLVEELLFRGVIQGALLSRSVLVVRTLGLSRANLITSLLFVGVHLINHSPGWAIAVLVPSLTLGHIRECYSSLAVPVLLHVFFNGIYIIAGTLTY